MSTPDILMLSTFSAAACTRNWLTDTASWVASAFTSSIKEGGMRSAKLLTVAMKASSE